MIKLINLIALLFVTQISFSQIKLSKLDKISIPKNIRYVGKIIDAVRWNDSVGNNIVITTEAGGIEGKKVDGDTYQNAALYAYHYVSKGDSLSLIWKMYDFIKDCELDLKVKFIKNTFTVTDLNKNGKAEIWLMYTTYCRGDIGSSDMKIIMYENQNKYAVRGLSKAQVSENEFTGGEYKLDEAFKKGPEVFRKYAQQLWEKNIMETWE